jgi:hypothetical protein
MSIPTNLLTPKLDTKRSVSLWLYAVARAGYSTHPDDSAWMTCGLIRRLGFPHPMPCDSAVVAPNGERGHVEIGNTVDGEWVPSFTPDEALLYDAAMARAFQVCYTHGMDIYAIALRAVEATR